MLKEYMKVNSTSAACVNCHLEHNGIKNIIDNKYFNIVIS